MFRRGDRVVLANHDARRMGAPIGATAVVIREAESRVYTVVKWDPDPSHTQRDGEYQVSLFALVSNEKQTAETMLADAAEYYAAVTEAAE